MIIDAYAHCHPQKWLPIESLRSAMTAARLWGFSPVTADGGAVAGGDWAT